MNRYITEIKARGLYDLEDFTIPVADDGCPHLIITGPNGSGKTALLNGVAKCLENLNDVGQVACDGVVLELSDAGMMSDSYRKEDFDMVYYGPYRESDAVRKIQDVVSKLRKRLDVSNDVSEQERIRQWFENFRKLLAKVYQDGGAQMRFTEQGECLIVGSGGRVSRFTDISGGIAAVLEIVCCLMYKFCGDDLLSWQWISEKKGVVLIDDVELHMGMQLQKVFMPLLVQMFPEVQFIITTHSPFVLSSMKDAVAFDLGSKELSEGLAYHSFEILARNYFGVEDEIDTVA